jgi:RNA polymerase sigma factor for flagellar operon FliA
MRTMGWYSRADYARYRAEERTQEYMQNVSEREGAAREAGAETTKAETLENLAELLSSIATVHITSMEAATNVSDDRIPSADATIEMGQLGTRVRQAMQTLPEKERRLMEMYYFEDKNLEEAGGLLGLSKSWACRLHARAVNLLREALADDA